MGDHTHPTTYSGASLGRLVNELGRVEGECSRDVVRSRHGQSSHHSPVLTT